jgi:hypothetical protein
VRAALGFEATPLRFPDARSPTLDEFLIQQELASITSGGPMDIVYLLLVAALFASSLGFVRLCDRVR